MDDSDLDEYDGMEDPGFLRRQISCQQDFVLQQLEHLGGGDEASERSGPPASSHGAGASSASTGVGGGASAARSGSVGSSSAPSSSASLSASLPASQGGGGTAAAAQAAAAAGAKQRDGSTGSITSHSTPSSRAAGARSRLQRGTAGDAAAAGAAAQPTEQANEEDGDWEDGPAGITFAEPVVTPTKSSGGCGSEDGGVRPSLSRVESLSNSFIDELEEAGPVSGVGEGEEVDSARGGGGSTASAASSPSAKPAKPGQDFWTAAALEPLAAQAAAAALATNEAAGGVDADADPMRSPFAASGAEFGIFDLGLRALSGSRTSSVDVVVSEWGAWAGGLHGWNVRLCLLPTPMHTILEMFIQHSQTPILRALATVGGQRAARRERHRQRTRQRARHEWRRRQPLGSAGARQAVWAGGLRRAAGRVSEEGEREWGQWSNRHCCALCCPTRAHWWPCLLL